jgi:hypothetical protein
VFAWLNERAPAGSSHTLDSSLRLRSVAFEQA